MLTIGSRHKAFECNKVLKKVLQARLLPGFLFVRGGLTLARSQAAKQINANPWRLDLDWRWHQRGLELGCTFSINPDAHSIGEIDLTQWGLAMARKEGFLPSVFLIRSSSAPSAHTLLIATQQTRMRD